MQTSIIVAHPYRIFRRGLHALLNNINEMQVVGEAENGRNALAVVNAFKPQVALIDIALEDCDCVEATQSIVREAARTRVIVLSINGDNRHATQVLQAGASGILRKDCETEELIQAVQRVAAGQTVHSRAYAGSEEKGN